MRGGRRTTRQSLTMKDYWIYIMTNRNNTVLYTGVTSDLQRRVSEHKTKEGSQFTRRYKVNKLVYSERFRNINEAITAEKKLKAGSRKKKIELIEQENPDWQDLFEN